MPLALPSTFLYCTVLKILLAEPNFRFVINYQFPVKGKRKSKDVPVHTMKAHRGSVSMAPLIHNISTR